MFFGRVLRIVQAVSFAPLLFLTLNSPCFAQSRQPTQDRDIDRKVDELLRKMTVEEKVGQVTQSFHFAKTSDFDQRITRGEIGSIADYFDVTDQNRLQHLAVEGSKLHIPLVFASDVIHGFRVMFPVPLGMAASWDMSMIEDAQRRAAFEARTLGQSWNFGPMLDIARDPRWGRIVEGAGEDPYLGAKIAVAQVKGFEGQGPLDGKHIATSLKHFAGYGASLGGRDHDDVNLSESQLRNVYLQPFKAGVAAGARTVMTAYIDLNNVPASGNTWLLDEVLRKEWNFNGLVISDNNAVSDMVPHGFARDKEAAAVRALAAGVDVSMSNAGTDFTPLVAAAEAGKLDMAELDRSVRRILRLKFELGVFDHPYVASAPLDKDVLTDELNAARRAAVESAVLLKNEGALLPLPTGKYHKVAVIGQLADSRQDTVGPWFADVDLAKVTTIRAALEQSRQFPEVEYAQGVQLARRYFSPFDALLKEKPQKRWTDAEAETEFQHAIDVAQHSDLVIAVMGELPNMSGESASTSSLDLPGRQEELLQAVAKIGKPIVLVLLNGRPLTIPWEAEHLPAILEMWYPGSEGGTALVDLLSGKANPSGKLTTTWVRDANQIPMYYAHNSTQDPTLQGRRYWDVPSTPLFPFGYGLSYTRFAFSALQVLNPAVRIGAPITVQADVENMGSQAGDTVAQLYIHQRFGSESRPIRELRGFERISLRPGEKKTIRFVLTPEDLMYWSTATRAWAQEASIFDVGVGEDSTAKLSTTFEVTP